MGNLFRLLTDVSELVDDVSTDAASMSTSVAQPVGTFDVLQYPLPYRVEEYSRLHVTRIDQRLFAK